MFLLLNLVLKPTLNSDQRFPLSLYISQRLWETASRFEVQFPELDKDCTNWKVTVTLVVLYTTFCYLFVLSKLNGSFWLDGYCRKLKNVPQ